MRIEPKQAFYNEDTGAVQPWKDIEVTDTVGNALVAEGLVTEIEGGGGGGGDFTTAEVTFVNTEDGKDYTARPLVLSNGVIKIDSFAVSTSVTVTVPLGENGTVLGLDVIEPDSTDGTPPTASGDIQFDIMAGGYVVTGDGTITAAGSISI